MTSLSIEARLARLEASQKCWQTLALVLAAGLLVAMVQSRPSSPTTTTISAQRFELLAPDGSIAAILGLHHFDPYQETTRPGLWLLQNDQVLGGFFVLKPRPDIPAIASLNLTEEKFGKVPSVGPAPKSTELWPGHLEIGNFRHTLVLSHDANFSSVIRSESRAEVFPRARPAIPDFVFTGTPVSGSSLLLCDEFGHTRLAFGAATLSDPSTGLRIPTGPSSVVRLDQEGKEVGDPRQSK